MLEKDGVLPSLWRSGPICIPPHSLESGRVEQGQAVGVIGVDFGMDRTHHQSEGSVSKGNGKGATGNPLATRIWLHQNADACAQVFGLKVIKVDGANPVTVIFDDPSQLSCRINILVAETKGLEGSLGEWGHIASDCPMLRVVFPMQNAVDIIWLQRPKSDRSILQQV